MQSDSTVFLGLALVFALVLVVGVGMWRRRRGAKDAMPGAGAQSAPAQLLDEESTVQSSPVVDAVARSAAASSLADAAASEPTHPAFTGEPAVESERLPESASDEKTDVGEVGSLVDVVAEAVSTVEPATREEVEPASEAKSEPEAAPEPEVASEAPPEPEVVSDPEAAPAPESASEFEAASEAAADQVEQPASAPADQLDQALTAGLAKTKTSLWGRVRKLFSGGHKLDDDLLDGLEEALLTADVGVKLTMRLVDELRDAAEAGEVESYEQVRALLRQRLESTLAAGASAASAPGEADPVTVVTGNGKDARPRVVLFVGVNGVGKTTTIGKVAAKVRERGHEVVLAAGDTFRAAAAEQLGVWAERTDSRLIRGDEGADPASVVFNAVEHAKQAGAPVVLADTAGRLHTKVDLMEEIQKVKRAVGKARDGAPDETWLVVDATTGQNALAQARAFNKALGLTGIVLTKLDGTAKGGVVVAIADELKETPLRFVGVGEKAEDLRPFHAPSFVRGVVGDD